MVLCDGANLTGCKCDGANLTGSKCDGANLTGSKCDGANLTCSECDGANLTGSKCDGANLTCSKCDGANLAGSKCDGANLTCFKCDGANITGSKCGANLTCSKYDGANITGSKCDGANLTGSKCDGANLTGSKCDGANLTGSKCDGANLTGSKCDGANVTCSKCDGANLTGSKCGANLTGSNYDGANLTGSKCDGANLTGSKYDGANITCSKCDGANLTGSKCDGANLTVFKYDGANLSSNMVSQQQPRIEKIYNYHESCNEEYKKSAVKQSNLQQHDSHTNEEFSVLRSKHTLLKQLEEAEKKCKFQNEMIDKTKTEKTDYECQIKTLEKIVEDLNLRLEESQVKQMQQQQAYTELTDEFQKHTIEANVKSEEETQTKAILTQQVEELNSIIQGKDENIQHLNKEMIKAKDSLEIQSSFDQTKSKIEENEMTLKHVHRELEVTKVNLETENVQWQKRNKCLQDKINSLIGDVEHQNKLLKEEEEKYNRLCLKHKESEASCVKLLTENEKLDMCLSQQKEENLILQKRLAHLNNDLISLQTVKNDLDQSLSQTLFKLEIQSTDLMNMSERLEEAEKKIQYLNEMLDKVKNENNDYDCHIQTLEKFGKDLEFRLEESQVNQMQQQQTYIELEAEFQKYKNEANVKSMQETQAKAILTQEVEELKIIIHGKDENVQHLNKELTQAKNALSKTQSSFDQTKAKLQETEMTLKHVHRELEVTKVNLETENVQWQKRNKCLQDKINSLIGDVEHQNKLLKEEEEKYNRLCLKHKESEASCVKLLTENEKLDMCLSQQKEENLILQKRLAHLNNDLISLQTVKNDLDQSLSQTLFKLEIQSTDLMNMSERLEEAEKKIQYLNEMLDKVKNENNDYDCHIQTLEKFGKDLEFRLEESQVNQMQQQQTYIELEAEFQKYKNEANVKSMQETQAKAILTQEVEELKIIIHGKDENVQHLNKELTQAKNALSKTQSSFDQTKAKLQETEMTLKHVHRELEVTKVNLETENVQWQKRNKCLQDKINSLIGDVEHQNKLLKEEEEKYNRLCLKHKESEASCVKLLTENEKLDMCLSQQKEENLILQKRLAHLNNDLISLQTVKNDLDQSLSQTLFKLEIQSTDLMNMSERLEEAEKKIQYLNEMLDKVKNENNDYDCHIQTLEKFGKDLEFRLEESQVNQMQQQQTYIELEAEFQKYKNEANVKSMQETQAKAILTQEVEELKIIIHGKDENVQHLNKELTQAKHALSKTQSSFDQTKAKLQETEMTLKHVHHELEVTKVNMETEIVQWQKRNKCLQDKINSLIGDVEHQNKLLKEEEKKYNRLCLKHKESEAFCVKLATENEKLDMCLSQQKEENLILQKRLAHLNNDLISLQTVKNDLDQSLSQTLFKLEIQSTDLMNMSERLEEAEKKIQYLNEMLDKIREENTAYESKIKTLERNVEDLNFRLEESKVTQTEHLAYRCFDKSVMLALPLVNDHSLAVI
ncbi:hypothetical protein ACJMK2_000987 [Sinanodonta woodiana]|uniref:Uncharacterized protein n=1 Tax=Sinanodonta woodiana TaxID=1069815 RepID=A0ABD3XU54_SINWO